MLFSDTDDPYFSVAGRELSLASRIAPSRQKITGSVMMRGVCDSHDKLSFTPQN